MKSIIFDVETTGLPEKTDQLNMQPHIIEFGAIYLDDEQNVIRTVNQLLNPGGSIYNRDMKNFGTTLPKIITKLTGITDEDLLGKPSFQEFLPFLYEFFQDADVQIAHNAAFDTKILGFELNRLNISEANNFPTPKTICTMQEYSNILSGKWPKLTELYEKIMQKPLVQTHRALDDCNAVLEILMKDEFFKKIGVK